MQRSDLLNSAPGSWWFLEEYLQLLEASILLASLFRYPMYKVHHSIVLALWFQYWSRVHMRVTAEVMNCQVSWGASKVYTIIFLTNYIQYVDSIHCIGNNFVPWKAILGEIISFFELWCDNDSEHIFSLISFNIMWICYQISKLKSIFTMQWPPGIKKKNLKLTIGCILLIIVIFTFFTF